MYPGEGEKRISCLRLMQVNVWGFEAANNVRAAKPLRVWSWSCSHKGTKDEIQIKEL